MGGLLAKFIVKFPFSTYSGPDGESPTVKEVTLENSLTGSVIGDKGSRIRDVRATAGARIRIGKITLVRKSRIGIIIRKMYIEISYFKIFKLI